MSNRMFMVSAEEPQDFANKVELYQEAGYAFWGTPYFAQGKHHLLMSLWVPDEGLSYHDVIDGKVQRISNGDESYE